MNVVPRRLLLLVLALAGLVPACGGDEAATCGPVAREALDPNSGLHIVPTADPPLYSSQPPTSGAHFSLEPPTGALQGPLAEPMQVTILEIGRVLLQHRDLPEADVATLEGYAEADDGVVVAPDPDLAEPLVLTAWVTKQTCSGLDTEAVEAFVTDQQGRGPGAG